jgi:GT2 family glycosyltransferase
MLAPVQAGPRPIWTAVVLNWNGREDTLWCLASLQAVERLDARVITVDNGSVDGSVDAIRAGFPDVELIEAGANLGYAGGNNLGIARALERGSDWVVLVNNDATVAPDLIDGFERAAGLRPDAGILAGKVYFQDRPTTIWFAGQRFSLLLGYSGKARGYEQLDGREFESVIDVERAVGALMAISRPALERVGAFDEDLFAYVEDAELALRARNAGYAVVFAPDAHAWHAVSASTGGASHSTHTLYYGTRNMIAVVERARPLPPIAKQLRRLSVVGSFALHALTRGNRWAALKAVGSGYADARAGRFGPRP